MPFKSFNSIFLSTNYEMIVAGPDDMPAHIKSSMFGCALTYAHFFTLI
jgi:thiamine phosphate synthase YjbQ (UPF0047 family)